MRSHRLVLSQRIGDKVRQRTLLNLGTDYPVPKKKWREVAGLAEALLHGRPPLLEAAPDVQAAAEDIVAKLRARGFRAEQEEARKPEVATVDLDTRSTRTRARSAASACASRPSMISASPTSSTAWASRAAKGALQPR